MKLNISTTSPGPRVMPSAKWAIQVLCKNPSVQALGLTQANTDLFRGISVFAVANTMIALFLMQVRGIQHANVLVGILWFTGGIASWLTAIFELFLGNTFAWCVFGSFAGYYFAFASVLTPAFGIAAAYEDPAELNNALGVFFCIWACLFLIFLMMSLRTNLIFVWIFTLVDCTAWLLAASYFQAAAEHAGTAVKLQKVQNLCNSFKYAARENTNSCLGWWCLLVCLCDGWLVPTRNPARRISRIWFQTPHRITCTRRGARQGQSSDISLLFTFTNSHEQERQA